MTPNLFSNLNRRKFIGLSTLFLIGACGAQTTQTTASGKSKIVFWTMQLKPQFDKYMTDLIAGFVKENPTAEVEWVDIPWGEMETKILSSVAAKTAPDVVNLNPQFASKLAEKKALVVPDYFLAAVKKNKKAHATFEAFSPSKKREYVEWITEAKTDATRDKRLAQAVEWMSEGKVRNWKYVNC